MATQEKNFKQGLTDFFRASYGLGAGGGRPDQEATGFAAGLVHAGVISVGDAAEAMEAGITLAGNDRAVWAAGRQGRRFNGLI